MKESKNTLVPKKFKILLIGDSCIDEYFIGFCERISPEAPVPILNIKETFNTPGMAANVKKNFQNLEQDVQFITNNTTIKKIRFIDKKTGQHLLRADNEPKIDSWNGQLPFYHSYNDFNAVVISDYNKGFLQYAHIEGILQACKKPIFIDTKKTDLRKFDGAIIKVNFLEYNKLISTPKDENGLIVTNGANGVMYKSRHYPAKKVEVSDVCGAGDTFLAFLVYGYLESNGDMDAAIDLATKAAGESVKHRGNYAPTLSEIYE